MDLQWRSRPGVGHALAVMHLPGRACARGWLRYGCTTCFHKTKPPYAGTCQEQAAQPACAGLTLHMPLHT